MTENPYEPSDNPAKPRPSHFSVVELLVVIGLIGLLVAFLLPMRRSAGPAARRVQCSNNLKQLAIALHNYHDEYGSFPPAYTVDATGRRLHSWRTLILPYMEFGPLYETLDLTKPWDHPANQHAHDKRPYTFSCPGADVPQQHTNYLALVGEEACLHPTRGRTLSEITDGTRHTVMLMEVPGSSAVHWMAPQDADLTTLLSVSADQELSHSSGFNIALVDGSVQFLLAETPPATRHALVTIAGDDQPEMD